MDDVRLTPAERQALDQIEFALCRQDRELDRALRTMCPKGGLRRLRRPRGAVGRRRGMRAAFIALPLVVACVGLVAGAAFDGSPLLILPALVVGVVALTAGVVWCSVAVYLRRTGDR